MVIDTLLIAFNCEKYKGGHSLKRNL